MALFLSVRALIWRVLRVGRVLMLTETPDMTWAQAIVAGAVWATIALLAIQAFKGGDK